MPGEVINLMQRISAVKERPDIFDRTGYLSLEIAEVVDRLAALSIDCLAARARRDSSAIETNTKIMRAHSHQLVAMIACIQVHFEAEARK